MKSTTDSRHVDSPCLFLKIVQFRKLKISGGLDQQPAWYQSRLGVDQRELPNESDAHNN